MSDLIFGPWPSADTYVNAIFVADTGLTDEDRLEENGIITTCEITTYESEAVEDIPLAVDRLALKIIMKVRENQVGRERKY